MKKHTTFVLITIIFALVIINCVYGYTLTRTYLVQQNIHLDTAANRQNGSDPLPDTANLLSVDEAGVRLATLRAGTENLNVSPEVQASVRDTVTRQYYDLVSIANRAEQNGFVTDERLVQQALNSDIARYGGPDGYATFLADNQIAAETYKSVTRIHVTASEYIQHLTASRITDTLLEETYRQMLTDDPELPPYDDIADEVRENLSGELAAVVQTELLTKATSQ